MPAGGRGNGENRGVGRSRALTTEWMSLSGVMGMGRGGLWVWSIQVARASDADAHGSKCPAPTGPVCCCR